jgi:hypothetical protein
MLQHQSGGISQNSKETGLITNGQTQCTAYNGTDLMPFAKPKFRAEMRMAQAGLYFST